MQLRSRLEQAAHRTNETLKPAPVEATEATLPHSGCQFAHASDKKNSNDLWLRHHPKSAALGH